MKRIYFLVVLFLILSGELIGQQDSLPVSVNLQPIQKDSIYNPAITITIDSSRKFLDSWGSLPPCIIPPKWWDTISLSSILLSPASGFIFVSPYNAKGAKEDVKKGKPLVLFSGGFGGMPDFNSQADKNFQGKYHVKFLSQGCIHNGTDENEAAYNEVIFHYLDKKYGTAWREELRPDAIGFEASENTLGTALKLASPLAIQIANPGNSAIEPTNQDPETSIWWYIMPTSGFALLLSLYLIKRRKD